MSGLLTIVTVHELRKASCDTQSKYRISIIPSELDIFRRFDYISHAQCNAHQFNGENHIFKVIFMVFAWHFRNESQYKLTSLSDASESRKSAIFLCEI